ncbi:MAG: chromosome segregation protein SMC [Rhodospirillales bacterium]|nr:MAG: chromosome segregation protein SMC [Rhodospirillales bacterium]
MRSALRFTLLRLNGFKSFVDPAELFIERGLTGIVGPNGCGKSNLVEALRWVMGESSARQMRGGEMDDVIFNGTAARRARDLAEVTVELETSGRPLPAGLPPASTLEIRRRIERGRGSLYRVNGKEVRARDVQLLFADAQTGARSSAIVSQGQIGGLISAKPKERRSLLEEAAGITGLHARRHEAEQRLTAAEANLERLDDVVATLQVQLDHLGKQARHAARFRALAESIRETEALLFALRWQAACAAVADANRRLSAAETAVAEATAAASATATRQTECAALLPGLRRAESEAAAEAQRLALAEDGLAAEERRLADEQAACRTRLEQARRDLAREEARTGEAEAALARLDDDADRVRRAAADEDRHNAEAEAALAATDADVRRLDGDLAEVTAAIATAEAERASLARGRNDLLARKQRLTARQAELARRRGDLDRRIQALPDVAALESAAAAAATGLEAVMQVFSAAERERGEADAASRNSAAAAQEAASRHAGLAAEATALEQVLGDGDHAGGTPLADLISAEPGLETALAAGVGDALLASTDRSAPVHWRTLPPSAHSRPLPDGSAPLSARVEAPPALSRCLAAVGLVNDDREGDRLQALLSPGQHLVSAEGALWRWDGYTRTAASSPAAMRLRQRARLQHVREAEAAAEAERDAAAARATAAGARLERALGAEREARGQLRAAETALSRAREARADAREQAARIAADRAALDEADAAATQEMAEVTTALAVAEAALSALPAHDAAQQRAQALRESLARARSRQGDRRAARDALLRDAKARHRRLAAIADETRSWAARREGAHGQAAELRERLAAAEAECGRLAALPADLARRRSALLSAAEAHARTRAETADRLSGAEAAAAEADRAARASEADLARAREDLVRAEAVAEQAAAARTAVAERIAEVLAVTPDRLAAAVEASSDTQQPQDPAAIERRLERLRRDRDLMGAVNLQAEEEAKSLAGRIDDLMSERRDLAAAVAKLRQAIGELDDEGRGRLLAAFAAADQHFRTLFTRLFGGGRAHLALVESDNPLQAGLEIMASPPGKRLQSLSLLSGGEQTLAALALVFAVFLCMPAPVCMLDEVDAPLDDANVDRLCSLLTELARETGTRFLVVTHHRMTMARMDRLFGVTMAERGISQLVSVDLARAEALVEPA